jgi:transposase-like protein
MKKPTGRRPSFPHAIRRIIAEKAASGELSYSQTARIYDVSEGAVGAWLKALPVETLRQPKVERRVPMTGSEARAKAIMEAEMFQFAQELSALDQEVLNLQIYRDSLAAT